MWASKTGYWAATGRGPPTRSSAAATETSEPRARPITVRGRSRDAGRPAHAAGAVADAPRVAERGEDDAIPPGHTPLVRAAASADDPARRAADEERRRALEPEQERLHRVAEGVVPPAPVPADDPVAGDDHGHRISAEGVADGARGAWVANAPRERRVRDDLAERDARGLRQHRGLELGHPVEVQGDPKERPAAREVFAELLARLLGVAAGAWGRRAEAPPRSEARHAVVARLNAESIGERFEPWRATPESPKQAGERLARRSPGRGDIPERQVEIHRPSPRARPRIVLPRASWLLTVLTQIPRIRASSRYERPLT